MKFQKTASVIALALFAAVALVLVVPAPPVQAAGFARSYQINSNLFGNGVTTSRPGSINSASDKDLTDGKCLNTAGYCTLRAALEQANYYTDGQATQITVGSTVYLASADGTTQTTTTRAVTGANPVTIVANGTTANFMTTTRNGYWSYGSFFSIAAPNVTLDLKSSVYLSSPDITDSALYVNGGSSQITGLKHWYTGYTIIQVGTGGAGSTFSGLTLGDDENYNAQNGIVLDSGANNVTVQNSYFGGLYTAGNDRNAWITTDYNDYGYGGSNWANVKNLTIQNNQFVNTSSGSCGGSSSVGCQAKGVSVEYYTTINGLKILSNTFSGAWQGGNQTPIRMYNSGGVTMSNLDINGNTFASQATGQGEGYATVTLPLDGNLAGTNYIRNNTFTANTSLGTRTGMAIYWNSNRSDQSDSNLTVSGNTFNGYGNVDGGTTSVRFYEAGTVTVERNIFGPATRATNQTAAANADDQTDGVLYNNYNTNTNLKMATWYPTATVVYNTTGQVVTNGTASGAVNPGKECSVDITVAYPASSGYQKPTRGARLDVYYSAAASSTTMQSAEVLLGSITVGSGVTANQTVNYPFNSGQGGEVRIQTQAVNVSSGSQAQSSQYSRYVTIGKNQCGPRMRVFQSATQSDPTYTRALRWTVTSTEALASSGAGALTKSDFVISTSNCSAGSVTVTTLTQITDTQWEVVATANDSCTITLSLPSGAVSDTDSPGNASITKTTDLAGNTLDATITYNNPLSRSPDTMTVYQGIAPGAMVTVTTATTTTTSTTSIVDDNGNVTGTVTTTVTTQVIPATAPIAVGLSLNNAWATVSNLTVPTGTTSATVQLTSAADLHNATQNSTLSYTVSSSDPNYDGLQLPTSAVTEKPVVVLNPVQGPTSGGTTVGVTVNWTAGGGITGVTFAGTSGAALSGSGTSFSVVTPAMTYTAITPVDVTVTFADVTIVTIPGVFSYVPRSGVSITKKAFSDAAHTVALPSGSVVVSGTTVYWTYTVTNTGETTLSTLGVVDNQLSAGSVSCPATTLAPVTSLTCSASGKVGS